MSDTSQGPGWWIASDGKWYPPESAPMPAAPTPPTAATPPTPEQEPTVVTPAPAKPPAPATPPVPDPTTIAPPPAPSTASGPIIPPPGGPPPPGTASAIPPPGIPPTGAVPLNPKKSGISKGCLTAIIVVVVLFVLAGASALFGLFFLADKVSENSDEIFGSTDCSFITDQQVSDVLGVPSDAYQFGSITGLAGQMFDTRVNMNGDSCLASSTDSTALVYLSKENTGDASTLYEAQLSAAKGSETDQGDGLSVITEPYLDREIDGLGDEAFCTLPDITGFSGVLVRDGDTLVYASVVPPNSTDDGCALAQDLAREIIAS